ncbi:glycerol-3-phosphate responsive antiterminator [Oceanirhabdus sp. W0125-5]|uniref:glycerol-3-phosphate responsive antiterminator n=1 Tax=Oceanirhabdus sp. W0125-5 TaxID=2999116 RepID=UPI0022F2F7D1|nr:glycerol-3-phosphate responsive antiterminator [Oceanirhabdus sp. W0125-5]WBW99244.1 glycerol-3-phosphate responsive antiterminator [Oceanirhabdus sp. W0125-5]
MGDNLYSRLQENPIIAAVKSEEKLKRALISPCEVIFLLYGNIFTLKDDILRIKEKGKLVYVHIDLLEGSSKDVIALQHIAEEIKPDGIISTKTNLLKHAKELGMFAIQRVFLLDSLSLVTGTKTIRTINANAVEILPGIMPSITETMVKRTGKPVIAGGLVSEKSHVINSINAGAVGISTSEEKIWYL